MALAVVNRAQGGSTASSTTVASPATSHTAGNLLVAMIEWNNGGGHTISGIANTAGDTWIQCGTVVTAGSNDIAIYYVKSSLGHASDVVTLTFGAAQIYRAIVVYQISGADTTSPLVSVRSNNGATSPATLPSFIFSGASEIICGIMSTGTGTTKTPPTGYVLTDFGVSGDANKYYGDFYHISTENGEVPSISFSPTSWIASGVSFKEAAGSGITHVQSTARASGGSATSFTITPGAQPSIGNAIIVPVSIYGASATISVTDNSSNTYTQAVTRDSAGTAFIWYCGKLTATNASFQITVTITSGASWWAASAIEVTNVGSGGLTVDQTVSQVTSPGATTLSTGTTASLTGPDDFVVACTNISNAQSSITVASVSPPWTQEYEVLPGTNTPGEGVSRSLTSTAGTTVNCSWTVSTTTTAANVLAAFRATTSGGAVATVQSFVWGPI